MYKYKKHKSIFIFQQCSLGSYSILDTVQGTGAIAVIQTEKKPCLPGAYILVETITQINNFCYYVNKINNFVTMLGSVQCYRKKRILGQVL